MNLGGRPAFRLWKRCCVAAAALCVAVLISHPSHAEKRSGGGEMVPNKPALGPAGERLNANTIVIISGNLSATYVTIAYDLSAVLDDGDEFRVLPVIGAKLNRHCKPNPPRSRVTSAINCSRSS